MKDCLEVYRGENGDVILVSVHDEMSRTMVLTPNAAAQLIMALQHCLARLN